MRIPKLYADTSVFGGVFDEEFQEASRTFFEQVRSGRFVLVASTLVQGELLGAPPAVRELLDAVVTTAELVQTSDEAVRLQLAYLDAGIVTPRSATDALHVALATVSGCVLIVSWNFRHIVNFQRIQMYNGINALNGYGQLAIYSPLEVVGDEDEDV